MRTFTYRDATAWLFWNIDLRDNRCVVTTGPMYRKGRTHVHEYADAGDTRKAHDRLVRRRLAKGYVETTPPPVPPLQKALEEALVANPDDVATHMAYADFLAEHGDPRGELIQIQLENERAPGWRRRNHLRRRAGELLNEHGRAWLGGLAAYLLEQSHTHATPFSFARGWLDTLYLEGLTVDLARTVAHAAQLRLLRELRVDGVAMEPWGSFHPGDDTPSGHVRPSVAVLAGSPNLSNLRRLHLRIEVMPYEFVGPFAFSPHLTRLTHLRLQTPDLPTDTLEVLMGSPLAGRLRVLDLQECGLTDLSADILARADLGKLELLNLDGNRLSDHGLRLLRASGAPLQAGNQNQLGLHDFYAHERGDEEWE